MVPILSTRGRLRARGTRAAGRRARWCWWWGGWCPNKRHDLAFQALASRGCEPGARMLCVGEPLSPEYRALVESWAGDGIAVTGGLPQPELNSAYAEADVMLSTSEHEGFCVPLLEAFAFDLPVVARPAGGMPEVGGDAVLWIDEPFDPAMAAELIDARRCATSRAARRAGPARARAAGGVRARAGGGADRGLGARARWPVSEPYDEDNLLDRVSDEATLELHYDRIREREQADAAPRGWGSTAAACSRWAAAGTRAATCSPSPPGT